jgi:acetylglutamate kinase
MDRIVLKIGGSELDREGFVEGLIEALRGLWGRYAVLLVHGGGKAIARLQERLCLEPRFVEGLRVTDDESLDVAEMVLSGLINKRLVGQMVAAGVPAVGLSGVDNGLLRVAKMAYDAYDLGWVGDIRETHVAPVEALLALGITPVVSPISLGLDGHTYNVNADHAAAVLACALGAAELTFVSNVPGVLGEAPPLNPPRTDDRRRSGHGGEEEAPSPVQVPSSGHTGEPIPMGEGWGGGSSPSPVGWTGEGWGGGLPACIPFLTPAEVDALIASGVINGGMVPKVRSALAALEQGVPRVRICDLQGLAAGGGTCFLAEQDETQRRGDAEAQRQRGKTRYGKRGYKTKHGIRNTQYITLNTQYEIRNTHRRKPDR